MQYKISVPVMYDRRNRFQDEKICHGWEKFILGDGNTCCYLQRRTDKKKKSRLSLPMTGKLIKEGKGYFWSRKYVWHADFNFRKGINKDWAFNCIINELM